MSNSGTLQGLPCKTVFLSKAFIYAIFVITYKLQRSGDRTRYMPINNTLWSIRMRASKEGKGHKAKGIGTTEAISRKPLAGRVHISGAEGLYTRPEINKVLRGYTERALGHPRGLPDSVVITIEKIRKRPGTLSLLPLSTVQCASPEEALNIVRKLLLDSGITKKAVQSSLRIITGKTVMRGAALIDSSSGGRLEPDKQRGVRVSRLGITKDAERRLSKRLAGKGINTDTVREALVLASKVASCKGLVAELCVSDDPDYTTGYIASKELGYVRIPNIKRSGSMHGGRVFFIKPEADIKSIITYLEKTAVIAVE